MLMNILQFVNNFKIFFDIFFLECFFFSLFSVFPEFLDRRGVNEYLVQ